MKRKKALTLLTLTCCSIILFASCSPKNKTISNFEVDKVNKIQVITSMGNPAYGANGKIITDRQEINEFIDTFNSGVIGQKAKSEDLTIGFSSLFSFYNDENIVAEYGFCCNDSNIIFWNDEYMNISYGEKTKTPFELYQESQSPEIVIDIDGQEMDLIRYNGDTYVKSKLSEETVEWINNYNSLTEYEQAAISFTPDLGEPLNP